MEERFNELRETFIHYASMIEREGIKELLEWLDDSDFYLAPASTGHHLSTECGLVEHSLNVCKMSLQLNEMLDKPVDKESVLISSLFHDLGKHEYFGKKYYKENILKSGKRSVPKPYEKNKEVLNIPHEITGLQVLSKYIDLTEEETWAILHHNGMYGDLKYTLQGKETPLYLIIHFADMWASRITEK